MECSVCLNEWNSITHVPRMLNCGHSYCENCLKLMYKSSTKNLTCPSCQVVHTFQSGDDLMKLIKNFSLLSLVDTQQPKINKSSSLTKSNSLNQNQNTFEKDLDDMEECKSESEDGEHQTKQLSSEEQKQLIPPRIKFNQKCEQHNLIIHSFVKETKELLCTKCIYEKNLHANQIDIVPQVIKDIKQGIESTRIMILYRKNQLNQSIKYMQRMQRGNREVIENKLNEHFAKIRKAVDQFEQRSKQKLDDLMDEQNQNLQTVQTEVEECLDKLYNDDLNLSSLESHDDSEIIYMTNIIDDLKSNLLNFKPQIEFDKVSIALQLRESAYEKIDNLLSTTCNLMLDNLRFDDESVIKFEHILEKDNYWLCINCNKKHNVDEIMCQSCQLFRPLEMYKNILHNPSEVTDEEIEALNNRRKMEKQLILDRDLDESQNTFWFMISSTWLYQWKSFISNKVQSLIVNEQDVSETLRVSENQNIGVLPPGPIDNSDLFIRANEKDMEVNPNLQLNVHYRAVNKEVWSVFHRMYSGGPIIVRENLNIYSKDISKKLSSKSKSQGRKSNNQNDLSKSNNIFAKNQLSPKQLQAGNRKKRNLFQSENIVGLGEEDGIPEEEIQNINIIGNLQMKSISNQQNLQNSRVENNIFGKNRSNISSNQQNSMNKKHQL